MEPEPVYGIDRPYPMVSGAGRMPADLPDDFLEALPTVHADGRRELVIVRVRINTTMEEDLSMLPKLNINSNSTPAQPPQNPSPSLVDVLKKVQADAWDVTITVGQKHRSVQVAYKAGTDTSWKSVSTTVDGLDRALSELLEG